jgi:hypothetical protein
MYARASLARSSMTCAAAWVSALPEGAPVTNQISPPWFSSHSSSSRRVPSKLRGAAPEWPGRSRPPHMPRGAVVFARRQRAGRLRDDSDRGAR